MGNAPFLSIRQRGQAEGVCNCIASLLNSFWSNWRIGGSKESFSRQSHREWVSPSQWEGNFSCGSLIALRIGDPIYRMPWLKSNWLFLKSLSSYDTMFITFALLAFESVLCVLLVGLPFFFFFVPTWKGI